MEPLSYPTIVTSRRVVKNLFPLDDTPAPYRIAIIGEAPGETEEDHGYPFVGASGSFLDFRLKDAGIARHSCFLGNVCQVRPPQNKISVFPWDGQEIRDGLAQLREDLAVFKPNLCVLLGNTPLHAAKANRPIGKFAADVSASDSDDEKENKKYPFKISSWRGSLFRADLLGTPFTGFKCLPSVHPAYVLRQYSNKPLLDLDLRRAASEGRTADLVLPKRDLITTLDAGTLCHIMDTWPTDLPCSLDIEGGLPECCVNDSVKSNSKKRRHIGWRCVSLSPRPSTAYVIAWWKFSVDEKIRLLRSFARLMFRSDVGKVMQNSLYEFFVLAYGYYIPIRNVRDDTMLKGWEVYCELPKGLSTQASIWTREPHWKDDEMYESTGENLAIGCGKDTAVTLEICTAQDAVLDPTLASCDRDAVQRRLARQHYQVNLQMLNPLLYMELRGIRYDQASVQKQLTETQLEITEVASRLNSSAGGELRGKKGSLSAQRLASCLYQISRVSTGTGKKKVEIQWRNSAYPPQYKKEAGRKTEKLTTDVEAILKLRKSCPGDEFLSGILQHRHLEGLLETLEIRPDSDGRVRCGYNVVGTETGRLTCYTSPTGAGANLQTITKKLRKNYVADPGFDFFQCDLAGADGWTVAAHCARLGDRTMLDDYLFGLKPARILALLYELGPSVNHLDRASLKNACRAVDSDGWLYFASKRVQHGTNYMMGIPTMMTQVMKDSFKLSGTPIYLEHGQATRLQQSYLYRYRGVPIWHQWAGSQLQAHASLTSASGHTRHFFGRIQDRWGKVDHDTLKEFLADEPQQNTTWATNLAMLRLWNDPENRRPDGSLIIEPLHQVHDALCGQWPQDVREWAKAKLRSYFNNPLTIADMEITIPFEGAWGPSWGELPNAI